MAEPRSWSMGLIVTKGCIVAKGKVRLYTSYPNELVSQAAEYELKPGPSEFKTVVENETDTGRS